MTAPRAMIVKEPGLDRREQDPAQRLSAESGEFARRIGVARAQQIAGAKGVVDELVVTVT